MGSSSGPLHCSFPQTTGLASPARASAQAPPTAAPHSSSRLHPITVSLLLSPAHGHSQQPLYTQPHPWGRPWQHLSTAWLSDEMKASRGLLDRTRAVAAAASSAHLSVSISPKKEPNVVLPDD